MANKLCKDCWIWQQFKEDCYFHWKGKRECTRFVKHQFDTEQFKTIIDREYLF